MIEITQNIDTLPVSLFLQRADLKKSWHWIVTVITTSAVKGEEVRTWRTLNA